MMMTVPKRGTGTGGEGREELLTVFMTDIAQLNEQLTTSV